MTWRRRALRPAAVAVAVAALALVAGGGWALAAAGDTERVSLGSTGDQANTGDSYAPAISGDGDKIAFWSYAGDLVPADDNGALEVFVRDCGAATTERISVASNEAEANGSSLSPAFSRDGRFVAFELAGNVDDIYVRDRQAGTTSLVSVAAGGGRANGDSSFPAISPSGDFVAFWSEASDLVGSDTNGAADLFVHDLRRGATERVNITENGAQSSGESMVFDAPAISASGRFVAFESRAADLGGAGTNGHSNIFLRDRLLATTERISKATGGGQASGDSFSPALSAEGRFVTFASAAPDLVGADANGLIDVFVRDVRGGATERASLAGGGAEASGGHSQDPAISAAGTAVAFQSFATNLVPGDSNASTDVFVHELALASPPPTAGPPPPGGPPAPVISPPASPPPGPLCFGEPATSVGTAGADLLTGTDGADVIVALGGDDTVRATDGADRICLGAGDDRARGASDADRLRGGGGDDRLSAGRGDDRALAGSGADRLRGGGADDRLDGGPGRDALDGGPGAPDRCDGGPGSDRAARCERQAALP